MVLKNCFMKAIKYVLYLRVVMVNINILHVYQQDPAYIVTYHRSTHAYIKKGHTTIQVSSLMCTPILLLFAHAYYAF